MVSNSSHAYILWKCLLWWGVYTDILSIFKIGLFSCWLSHFLRVLDDSPWIRYIFGNVVSPSVACLLIFHGVFYKGQASNFNRLECAIIFFMDHIFGVVLISEKLLQNRRSSTLSPMLASRSVLVLSCTWQSVIHFQLSFVKDVRSASRFCLSFHVHVHLFQRHWMQRLQILHWLAFAPLWKSHWLYFCETISGLSVLFQWPICLYSFQVSWGLNLHRFILSRSWVTSVVIFSSNLIVI